MKTVQFDSSKKFVEVSTGNKLKSGLTELNVYESLDRGFFAHNDWLGHAVRYHQIADYITRHVDNVHSILDVGCGDLNLLRFIWRNRCPFKGSYTGLDLRAQPDWLGQVQGYKYPVDLIKMDIVGDPASYVHGDNQVVVCTEVLEHVPRNTAKTLFDRLYSWTAPGGVLFLSSPNAGVSDSVAENHVGPEGPREWTYQAKIDMAALSGFEFTLATGTFIQLKKIPEEVKDQVLYQQLKATRPYAWFSVLMAGPFPEQSNNCLMVFRKPLKG